VSTGKMPNPPDQPTSQSAASSQAPAPPPQEAAPAPTATAEPLPLGADMARIIEEQVDIIAQRQVYHSQTMFGVGGMGTDVVTARNSALIVAQALRNQTTSMLEHALVNLGDAEIAQINDMTTPLKLNSQVAGILEGILIDTITKAYQGDPDRQRETRAMLTRLFEPANEQMLLQPKAMIEFQAPGPGPNARD
jgi:hypothetical protein